MKKRIFKMIISVMILVFGTLLIGCSAEPDNSPAYNVWTCEISYSEFYSIFEEELEDGYFIRAKLTDAQRNQVALSLTNEDGHNWTEDQIYNYFIERGFNQTEANQQKEWLMTIEHGIIANRTESTVNLLFN